MSDVKLIGFILMRTWSEPPIRNYLLTSYSAVQLSLHSLHWKFEDADGGLSKTTGEPELGHRNLKLYAVRWYLVL